MTEAQKTRRVAELMLFWRTGNEDRRVSVKDLLEAAKWRVCCELVECTFAEAIETIKTTRVH